MKFEYKFTKWFKGIAILLVIISHYYRYIDLNSPFRILSHVGFFGAALFGFLSAYGNYATYSMNGFTKNWLLLRVIKVYFPFLIITIFSDLFIYHTYEWDLNNIIGIFYGKNDFTMWFIPWIMIFYLIFYLIFKLRIAEKTKIISFVVIIILLTILLEGCSNIGSVWYTCNASLVAGIILRKYQLQWNQFKIGIVWLLFVINLILSLKFRSINLIKDYTTLFAGMFFCIGICALSLWNWFKVYIFKYTQKIISFIGSYAFFIYMVQKKTLILFESHPSYLLWLYVIVTIAVAFVLQNAYQYFVAKVISPRLQ